MALNLKKQRPLTPEPSDDSDSDFSIEASQDPLLGPVKKRILAKETALAKKKWIAEQKKMSDPMDTMVGATQEFDDEVTCISEEQATAKKEGGEALVDYLKEKKKIEKMLCAGEICLTEAEYATQQLLEVFKESHKRKQQQQPHGEKAVKKVKESLNDQTGKKVVANTCADQGAGDGGDGDEEDVVDLTSGALAKNSGLQPKFRLSATWSVAVKTITFNRGNTQGAFEVISLERAPKDSKSKPFSFNIPCRLLFHFITALERIGELKDGYKDVMPSHEVLEKMKADKEGYKDLSAYFRDAYSRKKFVIDGFTLQVDEVNYKTAHMTGSYTALVVTKELKEGKTSTADGGQAKAFTIALPVHLLPSLSVAMNHIHYLRSRQQ